MQPRLKSGIFVRALVRRVEAQGAQAYVVRKGAEDAGAVFIKVARLDGTAFVLNQVLGGDGERAWARPLGESADEAKVAAYFERQIKFDPDIWIVEIEDRQGRNFLDEKVV